MVFRSIVGVRTCRVVLNIALILLVGIVLTGCSKGVGGTYVHEHKGSEGESGTITIELKSGNKAVLTISGGPDAGSLPSVEGTWSVAGDKVTLVLPNNEVDVYTIKDGDLVGTGFGETMVFKKK